MDRITKIVFFQDPPLHRSLSQKSLTMNPKLSESLVLYRTTLYHHQQYTAGGMVHVI
jgi:hypothetical protein